MFRRLPKLFSESDLYIGYLPLAHVFELTIEISLLIIGIPIGFSNPQSLTDTSTRIKKGACVGDISALKPTLMCAVPTVLDRVSKAVWEKVKEGGPLMEAVSGLVARSASSPSAFTSPHPLTIPLASSCSIYSSSPPSSTPPYPRSSLQMVHEFVGLGID